MKKSLLLLALLMTFVVSHSAYALPSYPLQEGDYLHLDTYNPATRAGLMSFDIERSSQILGDEIWSFCLEPTVYINFNDKYLVTDITEGTGDATANSTAWGQMAWLYWNFDQGTLEKATGEDNKWSGLQYAFWDLAGHGDYNNSFGYESYITESLGAVNGGWTNSGRVAVAVNEGQDILMAAPVPEPATLLLLGTGLVGLAGVSRRKIKKA